MDFGKFKYEQNKKQQKARRKQHVTHLKEVKLRPKIEDHDYNFKVEHGRRFLELHDKVKFTVMFRGREMAHPEAGTRLLEKVIKDLELVGQVEIPARMLVEGLLGTFVREVYGTRRKDLIRLILNEGPRFPAIAEFYYHEVIERVLSIIRPILVRAAERGELPNDSLARFPQLIVAPMLVGIMWHAMFEKFEPLDIDAMVRAHINILFAGRAG